MEITWYGLSCFRITERKHASIVTDPYNGKLGLPQLKVKSDVVTVSHDAQGHNYTTAVAGKRHHLNGPGEYEIGNVFITGILTANESQAAQNVVFMFDFDGLTVAHLGDMHKVPRQTQIEALEQVNVLLVPVGDGNSLNAAQASELVSMLEPNVVIPMHYQLPNLKIELDNVDRFLKEMGVTDPSEQSSLKISSSNLPEETETVILVPKNLANFTGINMMSTKLLMRWNVRPETESEYFEFLVHEFIPGMNRLGITEIQVWYTAYGDCEQKLASGIAPTSEKMHFALNSDDWIKLLDKLNEYVNNFSKKIIPATRGFQI